MSHKLEALGLPFVADEMILRSAEPGDSAAVYDYRSNPEVAQWLTKVQVDESAWAEEFAQRIPHTLVVEVRGSLIGDVGVHVRNAIAQAEVANQAQAVEAELTWAFSPRVHGSGAASGAVRAVMARCFTNLGVRRLTASAFADNAASVRLMERVGFRCEGVARQAALHRDGAWRNFLTFAILEGEQAAPASA